MKSFTWRFLLCFLPVILAGMVTWDGLRPDNQKIFYQLFGTKFETKFGVDLEGGTILVYEIDTRKLEEKQEKDKSKGKETTALIVQQQQIAATNELAEALRERIDPTATYNIIIRPAGGEGRVEIIIPTGGDKKARAAEKIWAELISHMEKEWAVRKLEVPRGNFEELIKQIQQQKSDTIWKNQLFNPRNQASWDKLLEDASEWESVLIFSETYSMKSEPFAEVLGLLASPNVGSAKLADSLTGMAAFSGSMEPIRPIDRIKEVIRASIGTFEVKPEAVAGTVGNLATSSLTAYPIVPSSAGLVQYAGGESRTETTDVLDVFVEQMTTELIGVRSETVIRNWVKKQAWERMIDKVVYEFPPFRDSVAKELKSVFSEKDLLKRIPEELKGKEKEQAIEKEQEKLLQARLKTLAKELKLVPPDSFEEMVGRIQTRGNIVNQAMLEAANFIVGDMSSLSSLIDRGKVSQFIRDNYGPPPELIKADIDKYLGTVTDKEGLDSLTVEEVQRIKDLVSRVGALQFRILANSNDDKEAIDKAKKQIKSLTKAEWSELAEKGLPPPGPTTGSKKNPQPEKFTIELANNNDSVVTYSWVELGKQERAQLGLNNKARLDPDKRGRWLQFEANIGEPIHIDTIDRKGMPVQMWEGALFLRRDCRDRNLPESERNAKQYEYFVLVRNPEFDNKGKQTPDITGKYLTRAESTMGDSGPQVGFHFDSTGAELFGTLTRKNVPSGTGTDLSNQKNRFLGIVLDGQLVSAATVRSEIRSSGVITGQFTKKDVDSMVQILRSGALPASLKREPVSESTISATLGDDTIRMGLSSIAWAFVGVLVFMLIYYRFSGLVACIALFANLILTAGFMIFVQATFTLTGLAALVLMLGMAVDANVLIYERLREERERGANLALALRNGYERAFPTIIDTHLCSIFTAIILYTWGNDQLKGFGISLTVGLIISLFTSLYMTRTIFDFWLHRKMLHNLSMFKLLSKPNLQFMQYRYLVFSISMFIAFSGLILFLARAPEDLDIDFKGGTAFSGKLKEEDALTIGELRDIVNEKNQEKMLAKVKVEEEEAGDNYRYKLTYTFPDGTTSDPKIVRIIDPGPKGLKLVGVGSKDKRKEIVRKKAIGLPDASLEQIHSGQFTPREKRPTESPYFTVRTSEREREIVQTIIDMLFHKKDDTGKWKPMLKTNTMNLPDPDEIMNKYNGEYLYITFGDKEKENVAVTLAKALFERTMRDAFQLKAQEKLPLRFDFLPEGAGDNQGRYNKMKIRFTPPLKDEASKAEKKTDLDKVMQALGDMKIRFSEPQPERLENFDSSFAENTRFSALGAILLSWIGVVLYLWFRFGSWTFGMAAVVCLIHDLCFVIGLVAASYYLNGFLKIEDFKIDFTAVAALLTLVGYSVADTIVVFDRIREVRGKNPLLTAEMINESINQTLSRTLLTSGTTFVVVAILYWFGGPGIHLFAFIMVAGVFIGTYSSIYIASPLLLIFGEGKQSDAAKRATASAAAAKTTEAPA